MHNYNTYILLILSLQSLGPWNGQNINQETKTGSLIARSQLRNYVACQLRSIQLCRSSWEQREYAHQQKTSLLHRYDCFRKPALSGQSKSLGLWLRWLGRLLSQYTLNIRWSRGWNRTTIHSSQYSSDQLFAGSILGPSPTDLDQVVTRPASRLTKFHQKCSPS